MIKKALFSVVALGLTTVVLFGRDAASYIGTTYDRLTSSVMWYSSRCRVAKTGAPMRVNSAARTDSCSGS